MATAFRIILTLTLALSSTPLFHFQSAEAFMLDNKLGNLKVAAFHVKRFGQKFIDTKESAVSNLVKILNRYDIVLIQGTRDASGAAIKHLKEQLNINTDASWDYVTSGQLGRSKTYLERYTFFYKTNSAKVLTSYQVNDTSNDVYVREPFCVEFAYLSTSKSHSDLAVHRDSVVLLALHTPTDNTRQELQQLSTTIKSVAALYPRVSGYIAMGDMNADCRYLAAKWRNSLEIFHGEGFRSLITDTADTTVKESNDCAHDRVVVYGKELDVGDAKVFDFRSWLKLTESEALAVSDHFPVEFVLY